GGPTASPELRDADEADTAEDGNGERASDAGAYPETGDAGCEHEQTGERQGKATADANGEPDIRIGRDPRVDGVSAASGVLGCYTAASDDLVSEENGVRAEHDYDRQCHP